MVQRYEVYKTTPVKAKQFIYFNRVFSNKKNEKLFKAKLASEIKDKINISCYTEYKAFGPSLIYNISSF